MVLCVIVVVAVTVCSYYKHTDSELYYLQSRYYDPKIGRFINADAFASTGQSILGYNMFAYCNNNPICFVDELGENPYEYYRIR